MRGAVSFALAFKQVFPLLHCVSCSIWLNDFLNYMYRTNSCSQGFHFPTDFLACFVNTVHIFWCDMGSGQCSNDNKHYNRCSVYYTGM